MKTISAAQFQKRCLSILDQVEPEGIVITRNGKPVARLVPVNSKSAGAIGALKRKLKVKGNIMSTGRRWDAES